MYKMRLILIFLSVTFCTLMGCEKEEIFDLNINPKADYIINVGSTFQVNLTSNPSTGYSWKWANQESVTIVETTGHVFTADHAGMGSPGTDTWTFVGRNTGSDNIKLIYTRSGEISENQILKIITVLVN